MLQENSASAGSDFVGGATMVQTPHPDRQRSSHQVTSLVCRLLYFLQVWRAVSDERVTASAMAVMWGMLPHAFIRRLSAIAVLTDRYVSKIFNPNDS